VLRPAPAALPNVCYRASDKLTSMWIDEQIFQQLATDPRRLYDVRDRLTPSERKKLDERTILAKVYGAAADNVVWHEKPDFIVRSASAERAYGVEATRVFASGPDARLSETPGYSSSVLAGGGIRHRDDRAGFTVSTVSIVNADGVTVASRVPAIIREAQPLEEFLASLGTAIGDKEKIFPLDPSLSHANLIVDERAHVLLGIRRDDLSKILCSSVVAGPVLESSFREIFLLTGCHSGPVCVPLKALITLSRFFYFNVALSASDAGRAGTVAEDVKLFAGYLGSGTASPIGIREDRDGVELIFGDAGFVLTCDREGTQTTVHFYMDADWSQWEVPAAALPACPEEVKASVNELAANNAFVCDLAFPQAWP
jgi:hypothetical protein